MDKAILVDAICGKGFRSIEFAIDMEKTGLARFTGDQWNPDWDWNKGELQKLSIEQLEALYKA